MHKISDLISQISIRIVTVFFVGLRKRTILSLLAIFNNENCHNLCNLLYLFVISTIWPSIFLLFDYKHTRVIVRNETILKPHQRYLLGSCKRRDILIELNNTYVEIFPGRRAYSGKEGSIQGRPPQSWQQRYMFIM